MEAFIHGIILSFGLILPLGVQNVFVFNQGAAQSTFFRALPVILTASICDSFLILLAVLGVSLVVFSFVWLKAILFGVGFIFLLYMGWITWKNASIVPSHGEPRSFSPQKQIIFAASVSLLNPHAIMDTVGVIGTSSLSYTGMEKWIFTAACLVVSWIWFFSLAVAGRMVGKLNHAEKWMVRLNRVSAIIIWASALYIGWQLL
jgi:L-lysine exporter family protein LysE/ArgO